MRAFPPLPLQGCPVGDASAWGGGGGASAARAESVAERRETRLGNFQFLLAFSQSDSNQFIPDEKRSGTKGMDGPVVCGWEREERKREKKGGEKRKKEGGMEGGRESEQRERTIFSPKFSHLHLQFEHEGNTILTTLCCGWPSTGTTL